MPDFVVRTTTRKRIEYVLPAETNWGQIGKVIAVIAQDRTARGYSIGSDDAVTVTANEEEIVFWWESTPEAAFNE